MVLDVPFEMFLEFGNSFYALGVPSRHPVKIIAVVVALHLDDVPAALRVSFYDTDGSDAVSESVRVVERDDCLLWIFEYSVRVVPFSDSRMAVERHELGDK